MIFIKGLKELFFPQVCLVCNGYVSSDILCSRCLSGLPHTGFASLRNNPVERVFTGRLEVAAAFSEFYFEKNHLVQTLLHLLKYRGNRDAGIFLGECIGRSILSASPFFEVDFLIPLPLHPKKEHKRGYNQAAVICEGISRITGTEVNKEAICRNHHSETQTKKHRAERWKNVEGIFTLKKSKAINGKKVLLVDDVITTGATLESCGRVLMKVASSLSIATAAHASK